jgi:hypothetical protein
MMAQEETAGVPSRWMLPFVPDWRWQLGRPDTPWYPSMRLFRQPARGDWGSVTNEMARVMHAVLDAARRKTGTV